MGVLNTQGVGGWDRKKRGESQYQECERRQERVGEKGRELCMYLLMGYRSVILSYDEAALASRLMSESINVRTVK